MSRYDREREIGSGAFGKVWLVRTGIGRRCYVMKEINLSHLSPEDRQNAMTEVAVLSRCQHKHIIAYRDASIENNVLSIFMEYAEAGDLYGAILRRNGVPWPEQNIISWFIQICLALQYLHSENILHRDLKTQNIFMTRSRLIKVGDFGIARVLRGPEDLASTSIGTPFYISPEICQQKPYSYKSDIWALGCVLFEMAALEQAFKANDFLQLVTKILTGQRRELPRYCSALLHDLVEELLSIDHKMRPSTEQILAKPELETHLSKYLETHLSRQSHVPVLISPNRAPRTSSSGDSHEVSLKRSSSNAAENPSGRKRLNAIRIRPREDKQEEPKTFCSSRASGQCSNQSASNNGKRKSNLRVTFNLPNPRHVRNKTEGNLVASDITAIPSTSADTSRSRRLRSDDDILNTGFTVESDHGYGSLEVKLNKTKNLSGANRITLPKAPCKKKLKQRSRIPSTPETNDLFSLDIRSSGSKFSRTTPIKSSHNHCEHSQCHQCMLDLLWKNRIRGTAGSPTKTEEYSRLKNKLLLVYTDRLFKEVHQSLSYDWKNNVESSKGSVMGLMNSLNFQQVQNLPLMMQLVQLDMLKDSQS